MTEFRICPYCKEIMTYGPQTQVLYKSTTKDEKYMSKRVTYILYGWKCSLQDDYCDVLLDVKNADINNFNTKEAELQLELLLYS
jgi:hypothetical protein